ncbi:MAG: hypothetical protein AAF433_09130 [Bacteroidota bacterium]
MNRRKFIRLAGLSAFAVSSAGTAVLQADGSYIGDCATTADILGPFFRADAPFRQDLTYPDNAIETPLLIRGRLFGADCQQPIANAIVDIWHCDHRGDYDNDSEEYRCRGRVRTKADGSYSFKTFVPPPYGQRPKHIHYLVSEAEGHQDLVTQLYFQGDDRLPDHYWGRYPRDEKRILEVYTNDQELPEVWLDLYLKSA